MTQGKNIFLLTEKLYEKYIEIKDLDIKKHDWYIQVIWH